MQIGNARKSEERLQKLLAWAGFGSRRYCETLIRAGRVRINGRVARLGDRADPDADRIEVDGRLVMVKDRPHIYIALHKPRGIISSLADEMNRGRATIRDLIEIPGHLYPVGRLDKGSEGLILMTDDGQLAHRLTHPRYAHEKTYRVTVGGNMPAAAIDAWRQGISLDGRQTAPAKVKVVVRHGDATELIVVLREGRKRQIRRVAAILGHPVQRLIREKIGPLALGDLSPGSWRYLTKDEVTALRRYVADEADHGSPLPGMGMRARRRRRGRKRH